MRCFLFILLFCFRAVLTDVIFTSERCNRVTYGLRTVNGDPSRYKQCGPSGRVWIVPCAPQMTFDPEDRVCKERPDGRMMKPMRKYETPAKNIITTPAPIPSSYPVSAEVTQPAAAPEEFIFSTIRPKSRKPKGRTRGKFRKTTPIPTTPISTEIQRSTSLEVISESESVTESESTTTPKIVIFASKKNINGGNGRSEESRTRGKMGGGAAFTRPGRIRTTTSMPVTHATRFVPGLQQRVTVAPKETMGMPHTLAPYEKMDRREEVFGGDMTTMTPEYTVRYNGQTMTENEFLNQLLHIVQHQKTISERQQQEKFDKMEKERLRQEKEEKAREMERRRQLEEAEKARQAEMDRQAAIYAEQERMAMERERELERIRQEERKREMERLRQQEIALEVERMRELERAQMERQQKNERVRQELEAVRKQKEMEKIRKEQEEAREREMIRLEEERALEMERVREEEKERQEQLERLRQQEEERKRKKALMEEERKRKILEKEMEERRQKMIEEERKRKIMEKEMEERRQAIQEEEERRKEEEGRRKEKEMEERRRIQDQMKKEMEERTRLEAMEREREMMRQIIENEKEREMQATTPISTIKPIYRPDINIYRPPDVDPIRFTTQAPEWATPPPATWNPSWNTVTVEEETPGVVYSQCQINGECELKYDSDSFCAHPSSPSMYLQCAPLYGRLGRWTERHCPDTLIFMVSIGRCEKGVGGEQRKPYDPDNRVVIPRLPSETSFVEWKGNRVIDHQIPGPISPPRVYPPVPETHKPQIYNTIDEFPKDLLPTIPEVSPAETYAQQYQNHIHGSVISGGHRPYPPTVAPIIPVSYQITRIPQSVMNSNSIKSEIDLSHIHPLFPRVQPDFLSRILPSLNLKMHDEHSNPQSLGSVVKPVLKKIALNQTEQLLDRLLADQVTDEKIRKEIIDRLKSSNTDELKKTT